MRAMEVLREVMEVMEAMKVMELSCVVPVLVTCM
jgi:hypothetical protein